MANAAVALQFSDQIEAFLGMTPSKDEQARLREQLPRVRVADVDVQGGKR